MKVYLISQKNVAQFATHIECGLFLNIIFPEPFLCLGRTFFAEYCENEMYCG